MSLHVLTVGLPGGAVFKFSSRKPEHLLRFAETCLDIAEAVIEGLPDPAGPLTCWWLREGHRRYAWRT
jgi:hypothetical protein